MLQYIGKKDFSTMHYLSHQCLQNFGRCFFAIQEVVARGGTLNAVRQGTNNIFGQSIEVQLLRCDFYDLYHKR